MPTIYVRNVSELDAPVTIKPLTFGSPVKTIASFDELPQGGSAVLYILAHAVPNGLRTGKIDIIEEITLASQLKSRRAGPTLVIFDACFAKSFNEIPGFSWPTEFGLIFSCLEYERTWNKAAGDSPRQSLFSDAINMALNACIAKGEFSGLQSMLVDYFDGIQTPFVQASEELLQQVFFEASASKSASSDAAE